MEQQYLSHARNILTTGNVRPDRTNTGTRSIFGHQMRHNLQEGFPLLTSKFVAFRLVLVELIWILSGSTNNNDLVEQNCHIWDEWALKDRTPYTAAERHALLLAKMKKEGREGHYGSMAKRGDVDCVNFKGAMLELHLTCDDEGIPRDKVGPNDGKLGPVYGAQWRSWPAAREITKKTSNGYGYYMVDEIDQIHELIEGLKKQPYSRRHIVSAWNPADMPIEGRSHAENVSDNKQALPPCHTLFQFYVRDMSGKQRHDWIWKNKTGEADRVEATLRAERQQGLFTNREGFDGDQALIDRHSELYAAIEVPKLLDCQLYQRSADWFLGVPFNIASYSLLTMMVAQCVDMLPGEFIHTFGDSHIYGNHVDVVNAQLARELHPLPTVKINPEKKDIFSFTVEDFELVDYKHSGKLAGTVAI